MAGFNSTEDIPSAKTSFTTKKPPSGGELSGDIINSGTVGCWLFNEGTGTIATDLSLVGKNGIIASGTSWSINDDGLPCLSFSGLSGGITVPDWGAIAPQTEMTFLFRQYANSQKNQATFNINTGASVLNTHCPYSDGAIYWDAGNSSGKRISYNPGSTIGAWHTWIMTASASASFSNIYMDGTLKKSASLTPGFTQAAYNLYIGVMSSSNNWFDGKIDVLRVWNRALSGGEIATVSAAPYTGITD